MYWNGNLFPTETEISRAQTERQQQLGLQIALKHIRELQFAERLGTQKSSDGIWKDKHGTFETCIPLLIARF